MSNRSLHKLFRAVDRSRERNDAARCLRIHSLEGLHEILQRERCRADRTGDNFCMLIYEPRDEKLPQENLDRLIDIARQRIRLTDDLALIDSRWLAVVLSGTDAAGAWTVADDLATRYGPCGFPFVVTVYCYPSDSFQAIEDGVISTKMRRDKNPRPVQSLEIFFVRPLPAWKRITDVLGAIVGLIVFFPLFVLVALLIKLDSRGPLLFKQRRAGLGGKPFTIYKFRSMREDAEKQKNDLVAFSEQDGPAFKLRNDPRVTYLGRFLRTTSIDELPNFGMSCGEKCRWWAPDPCPARRRLPVPNGRSGDWT